MNYYYITGTSRGIGKEIANLLLKDTENIVVGIARTCTISHPNYQHITIDLSEVKECSKLQFDHHPDAQKLCLINNAGTLGTGHVGNIDSLSIIQTYNLNTITPSILMNNFITKYKNKKVDKIILNVSSGAGSNPIDGWASYCASKSALDMFSQVIAKEQSIQNTDNPFKIYSIRPGKVDTEMQAEIRETTFKDFSLVENFKTFKINGELLDPKLVAGRYINVINGKINIEGVVSSIA